MTQNALMAYHLRDEKDTRPYWETDHRGMMLPLVQSGYNNSVSYGVPGVLGGQGWQTMNDIVSGRSVTPDEIGHAAGDVAGAAMTGSFVGARPRATTGASEASPSGSRFYRGAAGDGQPSRGDVMWGSTSNDVAGRYAAAANGAVRDLEYRFKNPYVHDVGGAQWNNLPYPQDMLRLSSGDWLQPENIAKHAQAKGHDGLILKNINDDPALGNAPIADTVAALQRGTIYDGDGNLFFSNPKQSSAAASIDHLGKTATRSLDPLGYYSQALEVAKGLQGKGSPDQFLASMRNAGVKQAEIDATGLGNAFADRPSITRDDLVKHLTDNRVGVNAVEYGGKRGVMGRDPSQIGTAGEGKWSNYSLDPSNPSYRETVLHLPEDNRRGASLLEDRNKLLDAQYTDPAWPNLAGYAPGRTVREQLAAIDAEKSALPEAFSSGHFSEPNIIGHMMTSMNKHEGKPVYTLDQIQSDWGQKLRDGDVRDEAKIAELVARDKAMQPALDEARRNLFDLQEKHGYGHPATEEAKAHLQKTVDEKRLVLAEKDTAQAATAGHPLVNTTDQWTNTTLRRALQQAVDANADHIAVPSGKTVLGYNPGDTHGMNEFYDKIVPKNLMNILSKLDKAGGGRQFVNQLETPGRGMAGDGFTLFPITPKMREEARKGLPLFQAGVPMSTNGNQEYPQNALMRGY